MSKTSIPVFPAGCWPIKGSKASLFSEQSYIITFQPTSGNETWSDPSYSLPAFVDLFSRWSNTNQKKWQQATKATRDHIYKSAHSSTGLFTDYNNFDGTLNVTSNVTSVLGLMLGVMLGVKACFWKQTALISNT